MPEFRRKNTHDGDVADCLQSLCAQPLTNAAVIEVELDANTSVQTFSHGLLNRPYRGVIVVAQDAAVTIYPQLPSSVQEPKRLFGLRLSSAVKCSARVVVF